MQRHDANSANPANIVILGATGSIGTQALDVVRTHPARFRVVGLAAGGGRPELLARQVAETGARTVAVPDVAVAGTLAKELDALGARAGVEILAGPEAADQVAAMPSDVVLNGITGAAGLGPTLAALAAGRRLALANKESLVIGGPLVKALAGEGRIVPVDSEHSALMQALTAGRASEVRRLILTASGGPFRGRTRAELAAVTPEQAAEHPTWNMGPVITVNSATLVNKGLEVIEAHLLFDVPLAAIDVVVHPQSIVHSMVEYHDGSTIAQAGTPDMRLPIALGLTWPDRLADAAPRLDFTQALDWTFEPLDDEVFPAVRLARQAAEAGGTCPAIYNAANEVCVAAFREGRLPFLGIVGTLAAVLDRCSADPVDSVAAVLDADRRGRAQARAPRNGAGRVAVRRAPTGLAVRVCPGPAPAASIAV